MILQDATIYLDNLAQDAQNDVALQNELGSAYVKLGDIQGKPHTTTTGNTTAALENYQKASLLFESIAGLKNSDSDSQQAKRELISVYEKIGTTMSRAYLDSQKRSELLNKRISLIEELLIANPDDFKLKIELGRSYASFGNRLFNKNFEAGWQYYQEKVLPLLAKAEKSAPTDKDTLRLGTSVYSKLGLIFTEYGKLQKNLEERPEVIQQSFRNSLDYYGRALKVYEKRLELDRNNVVNRRNYVVGIVTVAVALRELEKFDESLIYFEKGHKLYEELARFDSKNLQAVFDLGDFYSALGLLYKQQGNYRAAISNFEKSLTFMDQVISADAAHHEAISYKTDVLTHLANTYSLSGELNRALNYYKQAEDLALANLTTEPADRLQYAMIHYQRGKTYLHHPAKRTSSEKAEFEFKKALELIDNIESDVMPMQKEIIRKQLGK